MPTDKILGICSYCQQIRIDNLNKVWIKRKDSPSLYDHYLAVYKDGLSHGLCPDCEVEIRKKYGLDTKLE